MIKVLIVDDDKLIRVIIKMILEKEGFSVSAVPSGDDALKLLNRGQETSPTDGEYALLITNVNMQGMSGLTLSKKVRKLSPGIKIIGMSGNGGNSENNDGCFDYVLSKPFDINELSRRVNQALNQRELHTLAEKRERYIA